MSRPKHLRAVRRALSTEGLPPGWTATAYSFPMVDVREGAVLTVSNLEAWEAHHAICQICGDVDDDWLCAAGQRLWDAVVVKLESGSVTSA